MLLHFQKNQWEARQCYMVCRLSYLLCRNHLALRRSVFPLLDSKALAHDVHLSVETVDAPASAIAQAVAQVAEEVDATLVVLGTNNVLVCPGRALLPNPQTPSYALWCGHRTGRYPCLWWALALCGWCTAMPVFLARPLWRRSTFVVCLQEL